jgi:hypothetical protein
MDHSRLSPLDFLHFVELDEFVGDWEELGLSVESDLWDLQLEIMADPEAVPVVSGTGGLRKLRFSPAGCSRGKSGAVRVCFTYFPKHWTVLLMMAYAKGRKESLTAGEKRGIKAYLATFEKWLDARNH